ncbi:hypothetical protein PPYR_09008 [Photinus pyralis]|uniref:Zasp-like motif domain-containing protein n=1 Tax=Photinus pyralis TaxID=7054 RepID=A0A1Y1KJD4_PHOPY|nr:uncharacterized protein LOC116171768 [Photinus pyralis]KAB0798015.1 hypothetical protein PPYR_09008 [Photinus pyralis]
MGCIYLVLFVIIAIISNASSKPIMVTFGTKQGPIVPPTPTTTHRVPPQDLKQPAPVSEQVNDIPNPSTYKPAVPLQYRQKLLGYKPHPNLILGTATDQKYFGSSNKFNSYKREQARALGLEYSGPQYFEVQPYELEREQKRILYKTQTQQYIQPRNDYWSGRDVPQIGVVYSSGVKYYVPDILLTNDAYSENDVYGKNDFKYQYYQ